MRQMRGQVMAVKTTNCMVIRHTRYYPAFERLLIDLIDSRFDVLCSLLIILELQDIGHGSLEPFQE
jgi:hypothetical protein